MGMPKAALGGVMVALSAVAALAQGVGLGNGGAGDAQGTVVRTETDVVVVPALVRDRTGALVYTLKAEDFLVKDDGVAQKVTLDADTGREALALVIVVEVGGAGAREFQNYSRIAPPLAPMLASIVGNVPRQIAVVTFDSHPALVQRFTQNVDEAAGTLRGLEPGCTRQHHLNNCEWPTAVHDEALGDNGAAILDSLEFAVGLLRGKPGFYRRTILLISEALDRGSETTVEEAVRDITDTNTTVYGVGFSTGRSEAAHYAARQLPTQPSGWQSANLLNLENHHPNPPHGCMGKDPHPDQDGPRNRWEQAYDCLAQLAPPLTLAKMAAIATVDGLRQNVPETVTRLTGGEYFKLGDEKGLEQDLATIGNHLPNRYMLSFHPEAPHEGLHALELSLPGYAGLEVTARTRYWPTPAPPAVGPTAR